MHCILRPFAFFRPWPPNPPHRDRPAGQANQQVGGSILGKSDGSAMLPLLLQPVLHLILLGLKGADPALADSRLSRVARAVDPIPAAVPARRLGRLVAM